MVFVTRLLKKQLLQARSWPGALPPAAYFSFLSAVNIGFEDFTPGDGFAVYKPANIHSKRSAGYGSSQAQALLSVYLLAMWVLTQFGQPFE
jgi:hypothetical protein